MTHHSSPPDSDSAFLPFARPDIGEAEIAEVVDALRSGWITTGPKTRLFEDRFREFLEGANDPSLEVIAVNSATAGLHLALEAMGVGAGDEVITTTFTFTATAEIIRYLGAHPVLVDCDETTLNINVEAIERKITPRTKCIIPVHFAGLAANMPEVLRIANHYGLRVLEDAAHALPTTSAGQLIGTLQSDATVFSFYANKTLATGEGGMIVTRDPQLAKRCRTMRLHGIDRDAFDRYSSRKPAWFYSVIAPGFKYNLTDIASSIGLHQLARVREMQSQRQQIANRYTEHLSAVPLRLPAQPPAGEMHAWHLYVIRLRDDTAYERDDVIAQLASRGVGSSVHYIPLHLHPYWRDTYQLTPESFPNATRAYARCLSLPIYSRMSESDSDKVIATLTDILQ